MYTFPSILFHYVFGDLSMLLNVKSIVFTSIDTSNSPDDGIRVVSNLERL